MFSSQPPGVLAEEAGTESGGRQPGEFGNAPGDIIQALDRVDRRKDTLFDKTAVDHLGDRWQSVSEKLNKATGLELGLAYTVLYQRLTDARDDKSKQGAVGDLDIFGEWSLPGNPKDKLGILGFEAEMRTRLFTSSRPSDLGENAGSLWETTNDVDSQDVSLVQLWWQQSFANEGTVLNQDGRLGLAPALRAASQHGYLATAHCVERNFADRRVAARLVNRQGRPFLLPL